MIATQFSMPGVKFVGVIPIDLNKKPARSDNEGKFGVLNVEVAKRTSAEVDSSTKIQTIVDGFASVTQSTLTANPSEADANGFTTSTITFQAKDAHGNDITTGGLIVTMSFGGTRLNCVVSNSVVDTVTINFIGIPSAFCSAMTASPVSILAGGSSTITIQVKDSGGEKITTGGAKVTMTSGSDSSISTVVDNNNGTYAATLTEEFPPLPPGIGYGDPYHYVTGLY